MAKKILLLCLSGLLSLSVFAAGKSFRLDDGIAEISGKLSGRLPAGTKIVIYDISASTQEASSYVIDGLTLELLELGSLRIVDRENIAKVRAELSFQMSGDVSDDSAQRLGAMLGAETLVTGSLDKLSGGYRLSLKAIQVETSEIQYMGTVNIAATDETETLLGQVNPRKSAAASVGSAARSVADFSGRLICSSVNFFFGIGSYMQGDFSGGRRVMFWELVSIGGLVWGASKNDAGEDGSFLMMAGGVGFAATVAYAYVRPWRYKRDPSMAVVTPGISFGSSPLNLRPASPREKRPLPVSLNLTVRY
ncbi:MAG: hypothetical protein JXP39_09970 [Spirochaetales bacterium]|nr:hypothetical protein [Spirochaetales bacterium]